MSSPAAVDVRTPDVVDDGRKALTDGTASILDQWLVKAFIVLPFVALALAVPFAWQWGLSWLDVGLGIGFYVLTGLGVTVGLHRYFTHGAFKACRGLRIALAIAGSLAFQGPITKWVADHRRHHAFSDKEGDPHSPWAFGTSPAALAKGFVHAHTGWLFGRDRTNVRRFAPDLLADRGIRVIDKLFLPIAAVSLLLPALIGGLVTMSWWGAVTAGFWAGLVRIALLSHVTWSVNSICHMFGDQPFASRDRSTNFWALAVVSFGESWHNLHHADPTCARHGVKPGQIDSSARLIWIFEKLGWARDVRWPTARRIERITVPAQR